MDTRQRGGRNRRGPRGRANGASKKELTGGWSQAPQTVTSNLAKPWYPYAVQLSGTQPATPVKVVYTASDVARAILVNAQLDEPASGISFRCFEVDFYCIADGASSVPPALTATVYGIPAGQSMATKGDVGTTSFPAALRYVWPVSMKVFPTSSTGTNDICSLTTSPNDAYYVVVRGVWCVD